VQKDPTWEVGPSKPEPLSARKKIAKRKTHGDLHFEGGTVALKLFHYTDQKKGLVTVTRLVKFSYFVVGKRMEVPTHQRM